MRGFDRNVGAPPPHRGIRAFRWGLAACPLALLSVVGPDAGASFEEALPERPMTAEAARGVAGGASADIVWPGVNNAGQSYDNLRFQATITGTSSTSGINISAWTLGTNRGSQFVPLSGGSNTGTYERRTIWPSNGKYDVVMRYNAFGTSWTDCTGTNPKDNDQFLVSSTRLHYIYFHNTSSGFGTTQWSLDDVERLVDQPEPGKPDENSDTIDGVYGQCEDFATNGLDKTQWRRREPDTITVPFWCQDLTTEFNSCGGCNWQNCQPVLDCANSIMDAGNQTGNKSVHVYVLDRIGCTAGGITAGALSIPVDDGTGNIRQFLAIDEAFDPDNSLSQLPTPPNPGQGDVEDWATALLSHEIFHIVNLGHTPVGASCPNNVFNRNLMCADLGRQMTTLQCSQTRTSMPYTNRN